MTDHETNVDFKPPRPPRHVGLMILGICVVSAGVLFAFSQQLGWTPGWLYVGLFAANLIVNVVCVALWNPVLFWRRMRIGPGTKKWDIAWTLMFLATLVALYIVATRELDAADRPPGPPGSEWLIGAAIFISGWTLWTRSMIANPFFEKTVRIQTDHGHRVIDKGSYAYVRHPGYVGLSAVLLSTPFLLACTWSFLPALTAVLLLVLRTVLEDRTLQSELAGYAEYAARVRFRWIPGVW